VLLHTETSPTTAPEVHHPIPTDRSPLLVGFGCELVGSASGTTAARGLRLVTLLHRSAHRLDGGPRMRTIGRVAVKLVDGAWVTIAERRWFELR